jgi:hypothetical protein
MGGGRPGMWIRCSAMHRSDRGVRLPSASSVATGPPSTGLGSAGVAAGARRGGLSTSPQAGQAPELSPGGNGKVGRWGGRRSAISFQRSANGGRGEWRASTREPTTIRDSYACPVKSRAETSRKRKVVPCLHFSCVTLELFLSRDRGVWQRSNVVMLRPDPNSLFKVVP